MDELELETFSMPNSVSKLVNNKLVADVQFLVGEKKTKVYGHQTILALGSPVFHRMFYGEMKLNAAEPIELPDLEFNGFINMIRYIYGCEMKIRIEDIGSTLLAGDKYLVHDFLQTVSDYIISITNHSNCFPVFDKLNEMKLIDSVFKSQCFSYVENLVQTCCDFETQDFLEIDQTTLIDILKMDDLSIPEFKLLEACIRWINAELERNNIPLTSENCCKAFDQFKPWICFSQVNKSDLREFSQIKNYLNNEELVEIFFNSSHSPRSNSLNFKRKRGMKHLKSRQLSVVSFDICSKTKASLIKFTLKCDKHFCIDRFCFDDKKIKLENESVYENGQEILDLKWGIENLSGYASGFYTLPDLILKPNSIYEFTFKSNDAIDLKYGNKIDLDMDKVNLVLNGNHFFHAITGYLFNNR